MNKWKKITAGLLLAVLFFGSQSHVQAQQRVDTYAEYEAAMGLAAESEVTVYRKADYTKGTFSNQLTTGEEGKAGYQIFEGTFQDTVIKGNGNYTVLLKKADFTNQNKLKKLYVATNIPNTGKIKFSNLTVNINGKVLRTYEKPLTDAKSKYCRLLVFDTKNTKAQDANIKNALLNGKNNRVKLQFQVSGFSYKKGETPVRPTAETAVTPVPTIVPVVTPNMEETKTPVTKAEKEDEIQELSAGKKAGVVLVLVASIGGIIASIIAVNRKQH